MSGHLTRAVTPLKHQRSLDHQVGRLRMGRCRFDLSRRVQADQRKDFELEPACRYRVSIGVPPSRGKQAHPVGVVCTARRWSAVRLRTAGPPGDFSRRLRISCASETPRPRARAPGRLGEFGGRGGSELQRNLRAVLVIAASRLNESRRGRPASMAPDVAVHLTRHGSSPYFSGA
jgi:hypothetical protein